MTDHDGPCESPGSAGRPPQDALDALLRDWHAQNAQRAAENRDRILNSLQGDPAANPPATPVRDRRVLPHPAAADAAVPTHAPGRAHASPPAGGADRPASRRSGG
ncbi:MAG: hypothetical protein L6R00_19565 [Phycisphaerae bacterium]|nr:hypothetical protein [Phycisphaerae bacterium]